MITMVRRIARKMANPERLDRIDWEIGDMGLFGEGDGGRYVGLRVGSAVETFSTHPGKAHAQIDSNVRGDSHRSVVFFPGEFMVFVGIGEERGAQYVDVVRKHAHPFGRSGIERASGPYRSVFRSGAIEVRPALPGIGFAVVPSG